MLFSVKSGDFHSRRDGPDIHPSAKSTRVKSGDHQRIDSCTPEAPQTVSDAVRSATPRPLLLSLSISAQFTFVRFSSISAFTQQRYSPGPFFRNPLPITSWSLHRAMPHFVFAGQYFAGCDALDLAVREAQLGTCHAESIASDPISLLGMGGASPRELKGPTFQIESNRNSDFSR
jgi:hypothetical protein